MVKRWKCWVTGLWLTNRTQKTRWQWRTLVDRHPSVRWGDAELSLHIHTQFQSHCESSLLRLFSIPSQLCHSPALSFVIIASCTVRLWRPDRRTQTVLMGVDRWLPAAEASEVTVKPLLSTVLPETWNHTNAHSLYTSPASIPCSDWISFSFYFFDLHLWSILMPFLTFHWHPSSTLTALGVSAQLMPHWPLQGDKLSESKLHHEQKIEHATFTEKSNTHSHPQYKRTEPKA